MWWLLDDYPNLKFLLTILFCGFLSILFIAYKCQNSLLYIPILQGLSRYSKDNPKGYRHPSEYNLTSEDITVSTPDNIKLKGWLIKSTSPLRSPTIVFFHENAGNLGTRLPFIEYYVKKNNFNFVIVAYRGYTESEGEPSENGLMIDSLSILDYTFARTDINTTKVFIHGRSLGGAVAIYSTTNTNHKISGVILENTFVSIPEMVKKLFPYLHVFKKLVLKISWPSIDRVMHIKCPKLFISARKDEIVPYEHMVQLYDSATAPKEWYEIAEGTHNGTYTVNPEEYFGKISAFVSKYQKKHSYQCNNIN